MTENEIIADLRARLAAAEKALEECKTKRDHYRHHQLLLRADMRELFEATKSFANIARIAEAREACEQLLEYIRLSEIEVTPKSVAEALSQPAPEPEEKVRPGQTVCPHGNPEPHSCMICFEWRPS